MMKKAKMDSLISHKTRSGSSGLQKTKDTALRKVNSARQEGFECINADNASQMVSIDSTEQAKRTISQRALLAQNFSAGSSISSFRKSTFGRKITSLCTRDSWSCSARPITRDICNGNFNATKESCVNTASDAYSSAQCKTTAVQIGLGHPDGMRNEDHTKSHLNGQSKVDRPKCPIPERIIPASHVSIGSSNLPTYHAVLAKRGLLAGDTLGAGSYSKVKHAYYHPPMNNCKIYPSQVAVKIIDRKKAPTDFQQRFLPRELDTWPQLRHSNIVKMLDCFSEGEKVYMILEYVEKGDALKFIQKNGALSESGSRLWIQQVINAVTYLHSLDIAHRDLKLENMLIDSCKNIKICDFGFVKKCSADDLCKTFCGSKSYAAPEILEGQPYPPKKADIWAIGVILFIMVTGKMPFDETKGNKSLLEEQRKPQFDWPVGKKSVSENCKSLTAFCLRFQWQNRPNIFELSTHSWLKT